MAAEAHIAIAAEKIGQIGPLPITNTLLMTWIGMAVLVVVSFVATRKMALVPSGFQNAVESGFEFFSDLVDSTVGDAKKASQFFAIVATFFFLILISNYLGLLPGVGSIGFWRHDEFVPLLRSANSDFNNTFALAVISVVATHFLAIKNLGVKEYLGKFFSLSPIFLFVGLLELVSEFTKLFSLSFRLFGNIFAGDTVLTTIGGLFAFVAPVPFLGLELIVGFVQALVFSILTLAFMVLLTTSHKAEEH